MKALRWTMAAALASVVGMARAEPNPPMLAALRPVPLSAVSIDDPFWSPRRTLWQTKTFADCFDKFEKSGALANFDAVVAGKTGGHRGEPWFDGLVYEMITAASDFMVTTPDAALAKRVDGFIDRIVAAAAKDPDGYINTYTTLKEPTHRWGTNGGNDRFQHDLYNVGCLAEAAVHHYRATGSTKLLNAAVKVANHMADLMGPPPKQNIIPGHALPEQAFYELAQLIDADPSVTTRLSVPVDAQRYQALAEFWIDARGNHAGRKTDGAYNQDHLPVTQQQTIEGHAVRATLLYGGMAAIANANGRPDYRSAAEMVWQNMTTRRTYVTGGIGAVAHDEKFGGDYELPNTGYAETCAAVSKSFFDHQINLLTGDASAANGLERSLYNGALTGVSASGDKYFYENPLHAKPDRDRWDWHACPCCPPMFLKLMGAMPSYVYATDDRGVYVNLFVGSKAKTKVADTELMISQETTYPTGGDVTIRVDPQQPAEFTVAVRVPDWCQAEPADALYRTAGNAAGRAFGVSVNGKPVTPVVEKGYARVRRQWTKGDTMNVLIDVSPRRVVANEAVEADRGKVSLAAGPIVYCLESADQTAPLESLSLLPTGDLTVQTRPDLLGGVTVLRGPAESKSANGTSRSVEFVAIPFYATANRGPRAMDVWVPVKK